MEIKIIVDEKKLEGIGFEGVMNEIMRSFKPQFPNTIFGRTVPFVKRPKVRVDTEKKIEVLDEEEVKSIEEVALLNLKKDVKKILGKKENEDLIEFVLDKLDASGLGKLIQK